MPKTQAEIEEAAEAILRGDVDILDFLTVKGQRQLIRMFEHLIDEAATGNTWSADVYARRAIALALGGMRVGRRTSG